MAYIVGLYDKDKLETIRAEGYDVMAVGREEVENFFDFHQKSHPEDLVESPNGSTVYAIVFVDSDCETFLRPFGRLTLDEERSDDPDYVKLRRMGILDSEGQQT